jgi:predicted ferric reductase
VVRHTCRRNLCLYHPVGDGSARYGSLARVATLRNTWLLEETHRYIANATVAFVAVHLTTLLLDPLIPFRPLNLLLPVDEPYRPLAVALGIFGLYLLVIVVASSWLRRHLPYVLWRLLHFGSFGTFWLVTLHGLLTGSDAGESWMRLIYLLAAGLVSAGMILRWFWASPDRNQGATYAGSSVRRNW